MPLMHADLSCYQIEIHVSSGILIHTREKPYICEKPCTWEKCGVGYLKSSKFMNHIITHEEKPFVLLWSLIIKDRLFQNLMNLMKQHICTYCKKLFF